MGFVSKTRQCNDSNSGLFENGKPDIVLKTVKGFNIKRIPFFKILIPENSFKLGIVVLVMLNKMLVIVLLSTYSFDMDWDPKNTVNFNLCPFLTLIVRNGSSVSFGTNVPWN